MDLSKTLNTSPVALANRPLMPEPILNTRSESKGINAVASEDINKSGILQTNSNYNEKENTLLPVTIQKDDYSNNYVILENEQHEKRESKEHEKKEHGKNEKKEKGENTEYKMNYTTQIYIGSLTILGLFVFYRLIQKSR
jgi:hypothetical protein